MKNIKNIKQSTAAIKQALKTKVDKIKSTAIHKQIKKPISISFKTFSLVKLYDSINKLLKLFLGKNYASFIALMLPILLILRKFSRGMWYFNLSLALALYLAKLLSLDVSITFDFLIYMLGAFINCFWDSICVMFEHFVNFIRVIVKLITDKINNTQQSFEYKNYMTRNKDWIKDYNYPNSITRDMKDSYIAVKDNDSFKKMLPDYENNHTVRNTLLTILGLLIIAAIIFYFYDPATFNNVVSISYNFIKTKLTTFKDYILSFFNKPTPPSDPAFPSTPTVQPVVDETNFYPQPPADSAPSYPGNAEDTVIDQTPMFQEMNDLDRIRNFASDHGRGYTFNGPDFFSNLFNSQREGSSNLPSNVSTPDSSNYTTPTPSNQVTPTQTNIPLPSDSSNSDIPPLAYTSPQRGSLLPDFRRPHSNFRYRQFYIAGDHTITITPPDDN